MTREPKAACVVCKEPLYEAPTECGWAKVRAREGLCFDCIESFYRVMASVREADGGTCLRPLEDDDVQALIKATVDVAIGAERAKWEAKLERLRDLQRINNETQEEPGYGWRNLMLVRAIDVMGAKP